MNHERASRISELIFQEAVHKEVVSALIIQEGKILLMRRAAHEPFAGAFELPGGTVEENETHQEALTREVLEETGLLITAIGNVICISDFSSKRGIRARNFVYAVETEHGTVTLSEEHDEYLFVHPKQAMKLPLTENARNALNAFLNS